MRSPTVDVQIKCPEWTSGGSFKRCSGCEHGKSYKDEKHAIDEPRQDLDAGVTVGVLAVALHLAA